jgi:hypothetical protein
MGVRTPPSYRPYFMVFHLIANLQYNLNKRCIQPSDFTYTVLIQ